MSLRQPKWERPTAENIEDERSCLAPAGFVCASKPDGLSSLYHLIVVIFKVGKKLPRPLIQGHGIWLCWPSHLKRFSDLLGFRCSFNLRPQSCRRWVWDIRSCQNARSSTDSTTSKQDEMIQWSSDRIHGEHLPVHPIVRSRYLAVTVKKDPTSRSSSP